MKLFVQLCFFSDFICVGKLLHWPIMLQETKSLYSMADLKWSDLYSQIYTDLGRT